MPHFQASWHQIPSPQSIHSTEARKHRNAFRNIGPKSKQARGLFDASCSVRVSAHTDFIITVGVEHFLHETIEASLGNIIDWCLLQELHNECNYQAYTTACHNSVQSVSNLRATM